MPDMEKVLKGLEMCTADLCKVDKSECPYCDYDAKEICIDRIMSDALALLKEQDTVDHALSVLREHGWKEDRQHLQTEIVRCKDCRFGSVWNNCILCDGVNGAHSPDWYCADGERKTDY